MRIIRAILVFLRRNFRHEAGSLRWLATSKKLNFRDVPKAVIHIVEIPHHFPHFPPGLTGQMNFPRSGSAPNILATLAGISVFSLLPLPVGEAAEIGLSRKKVAGTFPPLTVAAVVISGQIENGDAKKVEAFLAEINRTDDGRQIRRLLIHSPGGFVGEAMKIGRLLRANGVEVFIPLETSCISACILILAGGGTRTIEGQVGIDNPHFLRAAGPGDDVPALRAKTKQVMRDYFHSMGVDEELADAMFSVPDGAVRFLRQDELSQYHLKGLR